MLAYNPTTEEGEGSRFLSGMPGQPTLIAKWVRVHVSKQTKKWTCLKNSTQT